MKNAVNSDKVAESKIISNGKLKMMFLKNTSQGDLNVFHNALLLA